MEFHDLFGSEECGGFLVEHDLSISFREHCQIGIKFVTQNFTTSFTASKDICPVSTRIPSGGILVSQHLAAI